MFKIGQAVYYVKKSYGMHKVLDKRYNEEDQTFEYKLELVDEHGDREGHPFWTQAFKMFEE